MTPESELLTADPFDGDMDAPQRILQDRFRTAALQRHCTLCHCQIAVGSRYRAIVFIDDGLSEHKYCLKCCEDIYRP